jgi:hypothetical protein
VNRQSLKIIRRIPIHHTDNKRIGWYTVPTLP